ncbi:hypothetical protein AG4045_005157 [Apium graveolens]|uniref:Zinc finger PHD-type domain-containing protein n=1 Tax=Apium graveolens TaxID=4045 RepID=A0A6L5BCM3_APIGR|nr:hypothetical protein AG4045_005157 [Apium graveolens]
MQYVAEVAVNALREKKAANGGYNCETSRQENSEWVELAVERVLDSKQFVKEWLFIDEPDQLLRERILVTEVSGLEGVEDGEVLFGIVESGSELCFRAVGMDFGSELKYEGGADNWTVKCKCGTRDDGGERMVACDICEVWQHTRCIGIDDFNTMPPLFVCDSCCAALAPPRTIQPRI